MEAETNLAVASLMFSALSLLVMILGLAFIYYPGLREKVSGLSLSTTGGFVDNLKVLFLLGGALSPDIVLLIGFVSDIMNLEFRHSITSIIGIFAVIVHWGAGSAMKGVSVSVSTSSALPSVLPSVSPSIAETVATTVTQPPMVSAPQIFGVGDPQTIIGRTERYKAPAVPGSAARIPRRRTADGYTSMSSVNVDTPAAPGTGQTPRASKIRPRTGGALPDYINQKFNPCAIRGLGYFDIQGSPMGMAALSAIFAVYILDMYVGNKRTGGHIGAFVGFSAAVFALNVYAYRELGCVDRTSWGGTAKGIAMPLAVGLFVGGVGYAVLSSNYANFLPLDGTKFDDGTSGGSSSDNAPRGNQPHCSAPNTDDQMVCDAYQDGKRITSVPVS